MHIGASQLWPDVLYLGLILPPAITSVLVPVVDLLKAGNCYRLFEPAFPRSGARSDGELR